MDASCEIEALQYVFVDLQVQGEEGSYTVVMQLQPFIGEEQETFAETGMKFSLDPSYPDVAPSITFFGSKGLSDARLSRLRQEALGAAEELRGEPMLMSMCMAARDTLSEMNFPEGEVVVEQDCTSSGKSYVNNRSCTQGPVRFAWIR
jgi:hypothetical protein